MYAASGLNTKPTESLHQGQTSALRSAAAAPASPAVLRCSSSSSPEGAVPPCRALNAVVRRCAREGSREGRREKRKEVVCAFWLECTFHIGGPKYTFYMVWVVQVHVAWR